MLEIKLRSASKLMDVQLTVNHNCSRGVRVEHDVIGRTHQLFTKRDGLGRNRFYRGVRKARPLIIRQTGRTRRCDHFLCVDFVLLFHQIEKFIKRADRFSRPENQIATGIQPMMKLRDAALVQLR